MPRDINKAPKWQPDAIPTSRGWVHPKTGELLVSTKSIDPSLYEKKKEVKQSKPKTQTKKKVAKKTPVKKKKTSKKNAKK